MREGEREGEDEGGGEIHGRESPIGRLLAGSL